MTIEDPERFSKGDSTARSIIIKLNADMLDGADDDQLDSVLIFQPPQILGAAIIERRNLNGDTGQWQCATSVTAHIFFTIGAVTRLARTALAKHVTMCVHHDFSMAEHGNLRFLLAMFGSAAPSLLSEITVEKSLISIEVQRQSLSMQRHDCHRI